MRLLGTCRSGGRTATWSRESTPTRAAIQRSSASSSRPTKCYLTQPRSEARHALLKALQLDSYTAIAGCQSTCRCPADVDRLHCLAAEVSVRCHWQGAQERGGGLHGLLRRRWVQRGCLPAALLLCWESGSGAGMCDSGGGAAAARLCCSAQHHQNKHSSPSLLGSTAPLPLPHNPA